MASDNEAFCVSDPNFAVICSFLECFGKSCGIDYPDIATLQKMLEDTHEVPQPLVDLHIKLLRKTRKSVSSEKWERALVKFCHTYSNQDGWELERFGYKKARIGVKLRLLKVLLESQFDLNQKFKNEVNKLAAKELRVEPLGRDKTGLSYWFQLDEGCNIRVYREDLDEESWELVANDREGVVKLINTLSDGEIGAIPINEDSNSLEISEKPIIDTGQASTSSPSLDEDGGDGVAQENGDASNPKNQIQLNNKSINNEVIEKSLNKKNSEKITDECDNSDGGSEDEEEEEEEVEDDEAGDKEELSNDDDQISKQNTEDDDEEDEDEEDESQDTEGDIEETITVTGVATAVVSKVPVDPLKTQMKDGDCMKRNTVVAQELDNVERVIAKTSVIKPIIPEPIPVKSIETPVITTSPLKLVNIAELKHTTNDRVSDMTIPTPMSIIKTTSSEDSMSSTSKKHEKILLKNSSSFNEPIMSHGKFPIKPIDQLAANLVRMQSEKLEKPSASKLLEKIAENLARSSSAHGSSIMNGDDNKIPSDFSARNQPEKLNLIGNIRSSRGIDLSTSPRGWENTNDHNRPVDFSGIDLSSRKGTNTAPKPVDLPSLVYRPQEFQYREMDLSTRKVTKTELPNLPYDSRAAILRNHTMVTDLSKRQMPFVNYEMPSVATAAAYHGGARIPGKEEHRLANYTILPDPSKLASMRSVAVKRTLENADDPQQEMLKRMRADLMRGAIDKKPPMVCGLRRNDVGPAIEEPLMMVHGEGSGSDCDAGNPELGEAIEEPVIFFYGEGNGRDCDTGNPGDETSTNNNDSNESKDEGCSEISGPLSQTKGNGHDDTDTEKNAQLETISNVTSDIMKSVEINPDETDSNSTTTTTSNCQVSDIATTSECGKIKFKPSLGVQVIAKTSGPPMKRFSRWDVGAPEEKRECDSSIISNEKNISMESGISYEADNTPNSVTILPSVKAKLESDAITSTTNHSLSPNLMVSTIFTEKNEAPTNSENQCDSSSVEPMEVESTVQEEVPELSEDIKNRTTITCDDTDEAPRFFFGPNCVSFTPTPVGRVSFAPDATTSSSPPSTIRSASHDADGNTCTTVNNNSIKSSEVPATVSEPILAEADGGHSEKENCNKDEVTDLAPSPSESLTVCIDEELGGSENDEENTGDSELVMEDEKEEDEEKEIIDQIKKVDEDRPSTTVVNEVLDSPIVSSNYPENIRSGECAETLTLLDGKAHDDTVTNSECKEVEKFEINSPEVSTITESISSINEVCSTSTAEDEAGARSVETNVGVINSNSIEEQLKIEPTMDSTVTHERDHAKNESVETAAESTIDELNKKVEDDNIDSSQTDQEQKVESSVEDAPLHVVVEQTGEKTEETQQPCDTSEIIPINQPVSIQSSSAEAATLTDADSSDPKCSETVNAPSEVESENDELQKVVDSTDTFCDDFSDNQSNSVDQDSNEPMVIDERTSDSMESMKDSSTHAIEKFRSSDSEFPDSNTLEMNKVVNESTPYITSECSNSSPIVVAPAAVSPKDGKPDVKFDTISDKEDRKEDRKTTETTSSPIEEKSGLDVTTIHEQLSESSHHPSVDKSIFSLSSSKPSLISQGSLVANYDSNESNDTCIDDVFDTESGMDADSQGNDEPNVTESICSTQSPVELPNIPKVTEVEASTSIEKTPAIGIKIVEDAPSDRVTSEEDCHISNEIEKMAEKAVVETMDKPIFEENSIGESIESIKKSPVDESVMKQINEEPCDVGETLKISGVEHQDTTYVPVQTAIEITAGVILETAKSDSNELLISEPSQNAGEPEPLLEKNPEKDAQIEDMNKCNPEKTMGKRMGHIGIYDSEYSRSNSLAYTDEDDDDDADDDADLPIIQISKRAKTDIEELNQNVLDNSSRVNLQPSKELSLNETLHECGQVVSSPIITSEMKSKDYIKTLQIGENPEIDVPDNSSRVPLVNEYIETKIEGDACKNLGSISMKKSLEESEHKLNLDIIPTITESVQEDNIRESSVHIKPDIKIETSKQFHNAIESENVLRIESKAIQIDYIKDEPHTLMNDMKSTPDEKPIEVIDKTLNPAVQSIIAFTPPVLQLVEKGEMDVKSEENNRGCSNNLPEARQSESEHSQDTIVITDLSNAKPVEEHDDYSDDSMSVDNECIFESTENNVDPLSIVNDDETEERMDLENTDTKLSVRVKSMDEIQYEGWKLDSTEPVIPVTPKTSRKRRNSAHESNSEDGISKQSDNLEEMTGGKRMKLRGKRTPDMTLRKSVEDSRVEGVSSEDEAPIATESISPALSNPPPPIDEVKKEMVETTSVNQFKPKNKAKGGRRRRGFRSKRRASRHKKSGATSSVTETPILTADSTPIDDASESTPTARKKRKKRKMVLGLEIGIDIALPDSQSLGGALDETPVRQSRRIAQIKIKEQADRRRIEEEALGEMKEKKDRDVTDKKKRKKIKNESDDDPPVKLEVREEKELKSKKKRKKRRKEAKFNEAKPWQSSSGSSTEVEDQNDEDLDDEDIESEESLLFKSDHEFSPESDLEKDAETEPLRRARTAQKSQNDIEEAEDEYACQKCGKADHPEWILLCDTCDKGWHCSCLRPALMLIPEGDWFCPPCQHTLLVNKLRDSLKTYDQMAKRHENEILRKKRLAFVGISLDNVLQKNDVNRHHKSPRLSNRDDDDSDEDNDGDRDDDDEDDDDDAASNGGSSSSSESSDSGTSESGSSSDESEPVYQLRERRCANTYKFNEYDDMINAAIQDEVEAVQGAGNQGRGKDISTIVNAEKDETEVETFEKQIDEEHDDDKLSEKESDKDLSKDAEITDNEEQSRSLSSKKLLSRKKHRKLNSLDISSEDDPDSDEDFKGSSSEDDEDYEDQLLSSDDDSFTESRRRGKKNSRPVRRSTRAARKTRYDEDFINDDSDDSDRPKRKKSKSTWDESESEESDNSWRSRKKKSRPSALPRIRTLAKSKSKKKKKRKRIIEPDNQSDNENEEEEGGLEEIIRNVEEKAKVDEIDTPRALEPMEESIGIPINEEPVQTSILPEALTNVDEHSAVAINEEMIEREKNHEILPGKESKLEFPSYQTLPTLIVAEEEVEKKKERTPRQKKTPTIRRKIIYGGLPDDRQQQEEEPLGRRTRGRKINYQVDTIMSDSEEELKKALRKTEDSEDEFVVHEGDDVHDEGDKDSDSGDIYSPKKDAPKGRYKSPKNRRTRKISGGKSMSDNGEPKQRKKPGPKPGSKNKPRQPKSMMSSLEGGVIPDVAEGSLASLGTSELAELDDEQLEQMMMEDEEYGRRQLELAAIEIAKNKKKEEREAKKLEKARLKALEILAAEQQRDPNALEGTDGEAPKKKKRGRRSKAEILADQMRRDGAPHLGGSLTPSPNIPTIVSPPLSVVNPVVVPNMPVIMMPTDVVERPPPTEGQMPLISGPDGHLFNPDGTPMKPKRRGRGKGKKTLALEAARAAEAAAKAAAEAGGLGLTGGEVNSDLKHDDIPNVLPTPGSSTSGSAPSTPPAIAVTSQGLPPPSQSTNPQSVYPQLPPSQQSSVITRMLQSQPVSTAPQSFTAAAAAMGQKYFGVPNATSQMMGGPRQTYDMSSRGRIPSPYNSRLPGQPPPMPPHFAAVRSGTPPMRMRVPGPTQLYHTSHHPMDPSPSGGGPISISSRDRASPLGPGPAMIPPAAGSPLAKGGLTPPPYVRGGPPLSRFSDNPQLGSRHQLPPFTSASPANHSLQQPSPPPNRPPGNFSPYHPQPPPNYHYGAYPPPTPMPTADDAAAYQGSPYSAEHFSTSTENPPSIQPPTAQSSQPQVPPPPPPLPPPSAQQHSTPHPNEPVHGPAKQYDEEGTGEFGGLVSYFSSQREDDLDS